MSKQADDVVHRQEALETYLDQMFEREGLTFESWAAMFGQGFYRSRNELILELLRPLKPVRIFEFACAGGYLAQLLLSELHSIERYTCSNFSPRMIDYTRRQLAEHRHCTVELIDVDVTRSDDVARSNPSEYDVFLTTSFEHIQFDRELIARFPAGAHFVFSVTGFDDPEHFRVFCSEDEIRARYGDVLDILEVRHNPEVNKYVVVSRVPEPPGQTGRRSWWRSLRRWVGPRTSAGANAAPQMMFPPGRPASSGTGQQPFPWSDVVRDALRRWSTPFYLCAWPPVVAAFEELAALEGLGIPIRHWYSVKTQPLRPLLVACRERLGMGAEIVSLFELLAAREAGYTPTTIIANGLAKHAWLPADMRGLRVHLDSPREVDALGIDRLRSFRLGARVYVPCDHDPHDDTVGGQFGMEASDLPDMVSRLRTYGSKLEGMHFHLRSNIRDPARYAAAAEHVLNAAANAGVSPAYLDCGGGFPVPGEATVEGGRLISDELPLGRLVEELRPILRRHPSIQEVWFENGRFLTSRSGVLVVKVLDVKVRAGTRFVLCDGGRTNSALSADWQPNPLEVLPARTGPPADTVLVGPTCTAYDRLGRRALPADLDVGDYIVWHHAGAYHLSWQTRFSHGFAKILWCDERVRLSEARAPDDFHAWWGAWK